MCVSLSLSLCACASVRVCLYNNRLCINLYRSRVLLDFGVLDFVMVLAFGILVIRFGKLVVGFVPAWVQDFELV